MKVDVYWNLHKKKYSVRHKGKVIDHVPFIRLANVQWVVQPAGRRRVLRERRKNVHAFARGTWLEGNAVLRELTKSQALTKPIKVMYNPYRFKTFVLASAPDMACLWSDFAHLSSVFSVTHETYTPVAHTYNFIRPHRIDDYGSDFDQKDYGPRGT